MDVLIFLIVFGIIYKISKLSLENRVDNYPISKVDSGKMTHDLTSGKSYTEIKRNMVKGKYDSR